MKKAIIISSIVLILLVVSVIIYNKYSSPVIVKKGIDENGNKFVQLKSGGKTYNVLSDGLVTKWFLYEASIIEDELIVTRLNKEILRQKI